MMKKNKDNENYDHSDLISISEAARIRKVSHAAIQDLISRERLSAISIGGRRLVRRSEVESFKPESIGRPRKGQDEKASKQASNKGGKNTVNKGR